VTAIEAVLDISC